MVSMTPLCHTVVVLSRMAVGEPGVAAMVEGTNISPSQGVAGAVVTLTLMVGEVVTLLLTPRV